MNKTFVIYISSGFHSRIKTWKSAKKEWAMDKKETIKKQLLWKLRNTRKKSLLQCIYVIFMFFAKLAHFCPIFTPVLFILKHLKKWRLYSKKSFIKILNLKSFYSTAYEILRYKFLSDIPFLKAKKLMIPVFLFIM